MEVLKLSYNSLDCRSGKWVDLSRFHNHGTPHGGARPVMIAPGVMGFEFDGSNDYIRCKDSGNLAITDTITVQAWVIVKTVDSDYHWVISKDYGNNNLSFLLGLSSNNEFRFITRNLNADVYTGSLVAVNVWYHIVGVDDGTNIKIYQDGILMNSEPVSGNFVVNNVDILVGARQLNVPSEFFSGLVVQPAVANRAWSQDEIRENMYRSPLYRELRGLPRSFIQVPRNFRAWRRTEGGIYVP